MRHSPAPTLPQAPLPYLDRRWHDPLVSFGGSGSQRNASGPHFPKGQPDAAWRDTWPEGNGRPGGELAQMQNQHLDPNTIGLGILQMIVPHSSPYANPDIAAGLCRAINDWQVAEWTRRDHRPKASLVGLYEDAPAAIAEIERWLGHPDIVRVLLLWRTREPLGGRRSWAVDQGAARAELPVGVHACGYGGHPTTSDGWPNYYIEDMVGRAQTCAESGHGGGRFRVAAVAGLAAGQNVQDVAAGNPAPKAPTHRLPALGLQCPGSEQEAAHHGRAAPGFFHRQCTEAIRTQTLPGLPAKSDTHKRSRKPCRKLDPSGACR